MIHHALFQIVFQGFLVLAACVLLRMIVPRGNAVADLLRTLTKPVYKTAEAVSPAVWPEWSHGILAILWLLILRVAFYLIIATYGLLPPVPA